MQSIAKSQFIDEKTSLQKFVIFLIIWGVSPTLFLLQKPINVNLPRKLEENSDTKRFANPLILINQLTILIGQHRPFNGVKI